MHGSQKGDRQPTSAAVVDKQVLGVFVVCGPVAWNLDGGLLSANLPYTHSKNKLQNKLPGGSGRPGRNLNQSDLAPGRPLNLQFVFGVCGGGYRMDFQVANRDPNLGVAGWALGGAGVARLLHRIGEIPIRNRDFPEMNNRGNSK